jgi:hypothetical protein
VEWLARQYISGQFALEDYPRINSVLVNFEKLKPRLPIKDINRYTLYSLEDLMDKTMNVDLDNKSATDTGTFPVIDDSTVLYNGPLGQLAIPNTEIASCQLGNGTKWCTAGNENNQFVGYNANGKLYIWRDRNGEKFQISIETDLGNFEFMNAQNRPLDAEKAEYFRKKHPVMSKLFKKIESKIMKDPWPAYRYAVVVVKGRWPEAEPYIMTDAQTAAAYALGQLKARWPEAESIIKTDAGMAVKYVMKFMGRRWPEAEPYIMKDPWHALMYASQVINGRWREAEPYIMKDSFIAASYVERFGRKGVLD